ncbi:hypothetical protein GCM10027034_23500 [Ramlibacter solisilvae]|uniref:J domain-containing protein n=1 Tax=Ramlibacter tataouinensis TaxID=94132 RepID=A0A127JQ44_9BURK|nr:J domain-containing protein [Ramlibacter tataouinensis]AMO22059.1 hypothetical protein UC35_03170 [Ramlibacter tataouinensis]
MNHYDLLEVSHGASPEVIRAAYRSLMQRFHPDKNPGDAATGARAAAIAAAYDVLSDAGRRAEYDRQLQTAQAEPFPARAAPVAIRRAAAARAAPGGRSGMGLWWWLLPVIAAAAIGVFASLKPKKADPRAELAAVRQSFTAKAGTEAQRRELHARKTALLEQNPELFRSASSERSEDMAARTFVLLDGPQTIRVGQGHGGAVQPAELSLGGVSLLVGSFDAAEMLAHMGRHKERLVQDLVARLAKENPSRFTGPDGEAQLRRVVRDVVAGTLRTDPAQEYPSTWFESPGRYGVVDVLLPERFRLGPVQP